MDQTVTILGARGSVPVSGPGFARYGGATTCILVCLAGQPVVLDAGTGLLSLPEKGQSTPALPLLLTHLHLDHLLGLPLCPYALTPGNRLDLYGAPRDGVSLASALSRLFVPPFWPVGPEELPARFVFHDLQKEWDLGPVRVETKEGVHPGGVTLYKLTGGGKTVVFAPDCTLTEDQLTQMAEFARDCDLLLWDGQYSDGEFAARPHFGHSAWTVAARLAALSGARQARIIHHDPTHTDSILEEADRRVRAICPACRLAVQGEEIRL